MIRRLLVANRAEIASRVFRTCRDLGIGTVAVHSDADAGLPFVREADVAVRLPGDAPADTYLRGDLLVRAALDTGADAVHPGYGFLSESADFARQVLAAGLTWVGPRPESIEQMGSKVEAKKIMAAAGVPVLEAPAAPTAADLPLLVKASAGGGGRGMRIVRDLGDLDHEVATARAEAESAFGDGTVFVEPYVEGGRHVEVQVWGDAEANVSVLGDRDCSVQRRHQKVVEEAPAPGLSDEVRAALHDSARAAAEAIGYVGAGTVEFLYDERRQRFWFLEMNTRLQVEHPVTEAVTGLDLVALQVRAAEGDVGRVHVGSPDGHAVEVRLYAEDPARDWQPQSGRLDAFEVPAGVRVDTGFEAGSVVSTHYDAMLAKLVAHAPTRDHALRRLTGALERSRIHGLRTNRDLLVSVLRDDDFRAGRLGTDFLDRHDLATDVPEEVVQQSAFAAAVHLAERPRAVQPGIPAGWRNVRSAAQRTEFAETTVEWDRRGAAYVSGPWTAELSGRSGLIALTRADNSAVTRTFTVHAYGERVDVESSLGHVALTRVPRFTDPADRVASGSLLAPMPGSVVSVAVEPGQTLTAGTPVLVLEAMKMQHTIRAPHDGTVTDVPVAVGTQVAAGAVLAVVQEEDTP
ncbi:MAG: acetyl/propionyl-CoA carboxylase subunit alpha [Nocardioidaceae bacterium]|nr:acetyl/propionyl-CoA carboxylase subunit alpha [Nocardioidaceae bacterium]NUS52681.1 acetyl/propionyl-CoA carboxylase subunit alpha [Nocardioidaceae bacterium]